MAGGVPINGQVLRELRWLAGLTQAALAALGRQTVKSCCLSREDVNAYENRRENPSLFTLNAICEVICLAHVPAERRVLVCTPNLDAALAKASHPQAHANGGQATNRTDFLKLLLAGGTGVLLPPLQLDATSPDQLGEGLFRLYSTKPPADLLAHARLYAAQAGSVDAMCFAGWLAHLLDYRGEARAWFTQARKSASSDVERARALLSQSVAYTETRLGLLLAMEANDRGRAADPWTRLHTLVRLAHELAAAGDRKCCYQALDDAERLSGAADPAEQGGLFSPAALYAGWLRWMPLFRAECHVLLGDGAHAESELAQAGRCTSSPAHRAPARQLVIVGKTARLLDDPERACSALGDAWDQALATGYDRALGWVAEARTAFPPEWTPLPCVHGLDERMRLLT